MLDLDISENIIRKKMALDDVPLQAIDAFFR
jgi:hypothetical protein